MKVICISENWGGRYKQDDAGRFIRICPPGYYPIIPNEYTVTDTRTLEVHNTVQDFYQLAEFPPWQLWAAQNFSSLDTTTEKDVENEKKLTYELED